MAEVPVQLIVAAFQDENGAEAALTTLKEAKKARWITIENAAVIRRDANNKVHIKETADMGGGKGAVIGGVVGGVIGLLFPPSILVSGAIGAAVGGFVAKLSDGGFPDAKLREIGDALQPGTSAIVAVIDHVWVAEAQAQLEAEGARVVMESLKADISEQLQAGRDVSYSAVAAGGAMALDRTAAGADHVESSSLVMSDEGVTATSVVATPDSVQVAAMVSDASGTVVASGEFVPEAKAPEIEAPAGEAPADEAPAAPAAEAPAA